MRVSLARALFIEPDVLLPDPNPTPTPTPTPLPLPLPLPLLLPLPQVLLLDEPTNHLDLHAVLWLEEYLLGWGKSLVVVSHARSFLNAVCTDMLHFYDGTITRYKGDYDNFEATRSEQLKQQGRASERVEAQRAHMQAFVDKNRGNASKASMAQSRLKAMSRLEVVAAIMDPNPTPRLTLIPTPPLTLPPTPNP